MAHFSLETWDHGRLVVNHAFANLLRRQRWTTFAMIWSRTAEAAVAKNLRTDRVTLRFTLDDGGRQRAFYIKRHGRSSIKEYIKPLFSLRWPILGARNEWNALLAFHEAGLPTMMPVALGESGSNSFLITEALENCTKLSELTTDPRCEQDEVSNLTTGQSETAEFRRTIVERVARVTQQMHHAGLHHQDYYLGHLMLDDKGGRGESAPDRIYVIDLGRVRQKKPLGLRWIVKDLAQLNYSAREVPRTDRLRFLRKYLGHKFSTSDKRLIARIAAKTATIARHTKRNGL